MDNVEKPNFINHVFNFETDSKNEMVNIVQYCVLSIIFITLLNRGIQTYMPDIDKDKGSLAIENNKIIYCESVKVEKVLDLTGAGDLFAAGFLKEYIDNSEIKDCLNAGSKLASKIIQKIGARL